MTPKFSLSDLQKFMRLLRARKVSSEDYYLFQQFQGELLIRYLAHHHININDQLILDLACGLGGYGSAIRSGGGKVIGLDLNSVEGKKYFPFVISDALFTPFLGTSFDLVICASLIEHVEDPRALLNELIRLVPSNGYIYLSFPPFYSLNGGHQFSPFHYFGERIAIDVSRRCEVHSGQRWYKEIFTPDVKSFKTAFGNWGLYPLTIKKMAKIFNEFPIRVIDRSTRWIPLDFSGIPILGEILTWHVQFIIQKL